MKVLASRSGLTLTLLALTFFFCLLMSPTAPASACTGSGCSCQVGDCSATYPCGDPCPCLGINQLQAGDFLDVPIGTTTITSLSSNRALITISGFKSLGMFDGDSCEMALGSVNTVDHVNSVRVFDSDTGALLRALPFVRNANARNSFAAEATAQGVAPAGVWWQGFLDEVQGNVAKGRNLTFVLDVTLKNGATVARLANQLRSRGILGTGKAFSDGTVNPEHVHFRMLGNTGVQVQQ